MESKIVKLKDRDRQVVANDWGGREEKRQLLFNRHKVSVEQGEQAQRVTAEGRIRSGECGEELPINCFVPVIVRQMPSQVNSTSAFRNDMKGRSC